jgi:hypothetical protein
MTTNANHELFDHFSNAYISFDPIGTDFATSWDNSYLGAIRWCYLALISNDLNRLQFSAELLPAGSVVGEEIAFSSWGSTGFPQPNAGETIFVGYQATEDGSTYYGYLQITGTASPNPPNNDDGTFRVDLYSYETTPNTPITIVPEASSACLIFAAAGMLTWKRRRQA